MTIQLSIPVEFGNFLAHFLSLDSALTITPKNIIDGKMKMDVETSDEEFTLLKIALLLNIYTFLKDTNALITIHYVREFVSFRQ